MYVGAHVCSRSLYMCIFVCGRQRLTLGAFVLFSTLFFETGSLSEPGLARQWPWASARLHLPSELYEAVTASYVDAGEWRFEPRAVKTESIKH